MTKLPRLYPGHQHQWADGISSSTWARDYFTTSRELTYDLAQMLGDYCTGPDDDTETRPRGDQT